MAWNAPAQDWEALNHALRDFAASGSVEVCEDGQWLAELATLQCEVNRKGKQALVHLWSDERNLTRRVLRVKECAEDRIVLQVQRFGRTKPGRLEFLRTDSPRIAGRITREQFRGRVERTLKEFVAGNSGGAYRAFRKLAQGTESYFPPVSEKFRPNKKEGKRPGLNQYHFPGCVLEVIKILDVNGGKRLHEVAGSKEFRQASVKQILTPLFITMSDEPHQLS